MFRLLTLIQSGGWMIVPILLASIITLALIFECVWLIGKSRKRFESALINPKAAQHLATGDHADSALSVLHFRATHPRASAEEIRGYAELAFGELDRKVSWLQTIAAIAPLLGLLGTVSGMIANFQLVASTNPTNPLAQLSAGISEALVATGGGLIVAIVAALGFHWLTNRMDALMTRVVNVAVDPHGAPNEEVPFGS